MSEINNITFFSNNTNSDQEYLKLFEYTQLITGLYLLPFISLFGIFGSLSNIIVYKNSKKYSTNVYLIALSMSDIIKLANDFMYFLVSLIIRVDKDLGNIIFGRLYSFSHYIFVLTAINTSWLTCSIAIDRYIILLSTNHKQKFKRYYFSILISFLIAILSAIIAIPSPLFLKSIEELDPNTNRTIAKVAESTLMSLSFKKSYHYFNASFRAFIPLIMISYLNYKIIRIVYEKKMKKKNKNKTGCSIDKSKSKISLMLIIIVLTFTICIFPDAIMTMLLMGYANETYLIRSIREVTDLLLAINSATTFPICYFFSLQYRAKFKELFCYDQQTIKHKKVVMKNLEENASLIYNNSPSNNIAKETYLININQNVQ